MSIPTLYQLALAASLDSVDHFNADCPIKITLETLGVVFPPLDLDSDIPLIEQVLGYNNDDGEGISAWERDE